MTTRITEATPRYIQVAATVDEMRKATDLTVTELSRRSNVPRSTLRDRLAGKHPFTVEELYRVTEALGARLADACIWGAERNAFELGRDYERLQQAGR